MFYIDKYIEGLYVYFNSYYINNKNPYHNIEIITYLLLIHNIQLIVITLYTLCTFVIVSSI